MRQHKPKWDASTVASRAWTREERRVVWRGWFGRLTIAIEPLIVGLFFAALPIIMFHQKQEAAVFVAPIFGFVSILFVAYGIALMVPPTRALLETLTPIFIVDGYVEYEQRSGQSPQPEYFVAVLNSDRERLGEWQLRQWPTSIGDRTLWAALVEFSPYGGIHKIDGLSTGVLPSEVSPFGVGIARDDQRRGSKFR